MPQPDRLLKIKGCFSYKIDFYAKIIQTTIAFAEVSDQNFVDEEVEGEKESQICNAKRTNSFITDASSNDQVMHIIDCIILRIMKTLRGH
jgi:hypothetical protein